MKLNYKRTIFVGFAFFLITAFWQAYDTIVPKILTDKFGLAQTWSGAIMALDNIFALVLLPIFGAISDKVNSRAGRRTPFIVVGSICAAILLVSLSVADSAQLKRLEAVSGTEGAAYTESLGAIYDANPEVGDWKSDSLITGKKPLQELISREEFVAISMTATDENGESVTNPDYANIVVPARQAYAAAVTAKDHTPLVVFMVLLFFTLIAMGTFRSPAVALMPDVTIKPLRSKANAVINLMGTAGGILVLLLGTVFGTGKAKNALMNYTVFFAIVAGIMMVGLAVFLLKVREPRWAAEMQQESARLGLDRETQEQKETAVRTLSRGERISLLLILASVVFWFMGYNAVTSKYSVYASTVLNVDYNTTLLIAQAAAIVAYLPVGILSAKLGRKKMILGGVVILCASFFFASFLSAESPEVVKQVLMPLLFAMAGIGWATINVNSYPMVVELARGSNVGKYTGFYYTASMSAQVVTPILSGLFLDYISWRTLFPYAAVFVALAFVTMFFVRHGDAKPEAKATVLEGMGGAD
ncbi:MAG: MFS transporter [Clostridia bacterium]|nr:MFS transporter [Clostridia bacterium]